MSEDTGFRRKDGSQYTVTAKLSSANIWKQNPIMSELKRIGLVKETDDGKSVRKMPLSEIESNNISFDLLEKVYRNDAMIYNAINAISNWSVARGYFLDTKNPKAKKDVNDFLESFSFRELLIDIVRHLHIYGNAFVEVAYTDSGIPDSMYILDPKNIDFQRNGTDVLIDKFGDPISYRYYRGGTWIDLPAGKVLHFKINTVADSFWGIGVIEPLYKILTIKKNIELGLGEAIYRVGFPWVIVKIGDIDNEPSQSQLNEEGANFSDVSSRNALVVPYFYNIQFVESKSLENAGKYTDYFSGQVIAGTGVPKSILMGVGDDSNRNVAQAQQQNFAIILQSVQKMVAEKIEKKIFVKLSNNKVALRFEEIIPENPLELARRDAIEIEAGIKTVNEVRAERGLPPLRRTPDPKKPDDEPEEDPEEDVDTSDESMFTDTTKIRRSFSQDADNFFTSMKDEFIKKIGLLISEEGQTEFERDPIGFIEKHFNFDHLALFKFIYRYSSLSFLQGVQKAAMEIRVDPGSPSDSQIKIIQMHCLNIAKNTINKILTKVQYAIIDNRLSGEKAEELEFDILSIFKKFGGVEGTNKDSTRDLIVDSEVSRGVNRGKLWLYYNNGVTKVKIITRASEAKCRKCKVYANKIVQIELANNILPVHPHCTCEFIAEVEDDENGS